ncbi:hypothetical protein CY34DRAFT_798799 [Suillus luteus UH-Slu-Lm8-n1]|uniref:Uncharacterized protein n=1 Tax=Suillus luteus UH-Slu-Lm8-n1 TaxID=930992 RepID=A0A0D0BYM9_9AGAM|nr:hypothetical protein CY34DRAFT_798799 [Suillus luteus UH-Slu-Lm8-n1]
MSPFLSLKRLSINSKLSRRSSSHSSKSTSTRDSIQGHPSPMDITYAVAFSPSTTPSYPTFEGTPAVGGYAEMLDDDNMSWGSRSSGRQQRSLF